MRDEAQSYAQYPFMIYQIQTKIRDEARPRAGLIRVREFTMKDAYSFHTSQQDLDAFYARCLEAYHRIFARVGLPQVVAVASDAGMMGGRVSHEFMLLTPIGEDSIALCPHCGYRANLEAAACCLDPDAAAPAKTAYQGGYAGCAHNRGTMCLPADHTEETARRSHMRRPGMADWCSCFCAAIWRSTKQN